MNQATTILTRADRLPWESMLHPEFSVFIVDDSEIDRRIVRSAVDANSRVEVFSTSEDCLARLAEPGAAVSLFLLDVSMPGIDGYELCRQIRQRASHQDTPVIFISGNHDLESRIRGYEAGGTDFMGKPVNLVELRQKIAFAKQTILEREKLTERVAETESRVSVVATRLDENIALVKFLRDLIKCQTPPAILHVLFDLLQSYNLKTTIQIRVAEQELTLSDRRKNLPIELDVIRHMLDMGRIFQFKTHCAFNFDHISIIVKNMPGDDPDACSRIHDYVTAPTPKDVGFPLQGPRPVR